MATMQPCNWFLLYVSLLALLPSISSSSHAPNIDFNARMVNGIPTTWNQYPFIAGMKEYELDSTTSTVELSKNLCGATLIRKAYPAAFITAAHCLYDDDDLFFLQIKATDQDETPVFGLTAWFIYHYIIHEDFDENSLRNDLAIILLDVDLSSRIDISAVTLSSNVDCCDENDALRVVGYGKQGLDEEWTDTLQYADIEYISLTECDQRFCRYETGRSSCSWQPTTANNLCGMGPSLGAPCYGDSGGPLMREGTLEMVGIVSWGIQCIESLPTVFINVASYRVWIQTQLALYSGFDVQWPPLYEWQDSWSPTLSPTPAPTANPTEMPSTSLPPSAVPTHNPTTVPPTLQPTSQPSEIPSMFPTSFPSSQSPTHFPSQTPTRLPTPSPSMIPTQIPTVLPSFSPSFDPTISPVVPTAFPTRTPLTAAPSDVPTQNPSFRETARPSLHPLPSRTAPPTNQPSILPTVTPTGVPSAEPSTSRAPSSTPTSVPSVSPTQNPTRNPLPNPRPVRTSFPTSTPTSLPSVSPTTNPTRSPIRKSKNPTKAPHIEISTRMPSESPSNPKTESPTSVAKQVQNTMLETSQTLELDLLQGRNETLSGLQLGLIIAALCLCMFVLLLLIKYAKCLRPDQQHEYDSLKATNGASVVTTAEEESAEDQELEMESMPDIALPHFTTDTADHGEAKRETSFNE